MPGIKCPHNCGVTYDSSQSLAYNAHLNATASVSAIRVRVWVCPACAGHNFTVDKRSNTGGAALIESKYNVLATYPRSGRVPPPEVPDSIARDYREAALVLDDSPRASAVLSRRALQAILKSQLGATGGDLAKQIDSVENELPPTLKDSLTALRHMGNFAAHEKLDVNNGDIIEVDRDEAEWALEVVESLFEHVYIAPARDAERLAKFNEKLTSSGKQPIGPDLETSPTGD